MSYDATTLIKEAQARLEAMDPAERRRKQAQAVEDLSRDTADTAARRRELLASERLRLARRAVEEAVARGQHPQTPPPGRQYKNQHTAKPTAAALVLEAARRLAEGDGPLTGGRFSLADLVVACWEADPAVFGLTGYAQFPSDAKVRNALYAPQGPMRTGRIRRVGNLLEYVP